VAALPKVAPFPELPLPIVFENKTHFVICNILPNLCSDLILGLDSSYKMGLVINTADHTWYYQMCPEDTYHFENKEDTGNNIPFLDVCT
jgi:hypothetical protein